MVLALTAKNLGRPRDLASDAKTIAVLADAAGINVVSVKDAREAAAALLGLQLIILSASQRYLKFSASSLLN